MPVPTTPPPASGRTPRAPRRQRAGRPVKRRAQLSSIQIQVLAIGAVLFALLLYLFMLRAGEDGLVRVDGNRIQVSLREFAMSPQSVSVKRGNIVVSATNRGEQVHNLQIETIIGRDTDERPKTLLAISAMQPGQTKTGSLTLLPGKYRWRSSIANDDDLGMYGVVEVRQ